uniref:Uncharacterized protein n=1 Tax=Globodera rostochiensis TaxID=31243 RepID=A0A914HP24_GLORO
MDKEFIQNGNVLRLSRYNFAKLQEIPTCPMTACQQSQSAKPITTTTTTNPTTTTTTTTTVSSTVLHPASALSWIERVAVKCGTSFSFATRSISKFKTILLIICQLVLAIACAMSVEVHLDAN